MATVIPDETSLGNQYPWSVNARKLRVWFRATLILFACWIGAFFAPDEARVYMFPLGVFGAFIASIGCIIYAYRIQLVLHQLGFSQTGSWVVAVIPFLIGPVLAGIFASIIILSSVKKITRRLEEGSLVMPQIPLRAS